MENTIEKTPDYLILINGENRLPENFEETIELITVENSGGEIFRIEKKTYEAFLRLREKLMKEDNLQIELISVYRSIREQEATYERYLKNFGEEYTKKYVALPGCSEHHTGFAIDVGIVVGGRLKNSIAELLEADDLFGIIQANLPAYGFILRYPKDKEDVTKIGYESWHFRYIDSAEIAKEITDKGICFEEYWENK